MVKILGLERIRKKIVLYEKYKKRILSSNQNSPDNKVRRETESEELVAETRKMALMFEKKMKK